MRKLVLSSQNTARSLAARLPAHTFTRFPGDEKPRFKFAKYSRKSYRKVSGSHLYSFSSIKNFLKTIKEKCFFIPLTYMYTYNEPSK